MKRDMDMVRSILTAREESREANLYFHDDEARHVAILIDAGFVEGAVFKTSGHGIGKAVVERLTWSGHEFAEAARNDSIWQHTKDTIAKKGVPATFEIVKAMLIAEAKRHLGLP